MGHPGFTHYISLKATKFGVKDSELFESFNSCLCKFIFYTGAGCDVTTGTDVLDNLQSLKTLSAL